MALVRRLWGHERKHGDEVEPAVRFSAIFALTDLDVCCELCYSSPFLGWMMRAITAITILVARRVPTTRSPSDTWADPQLRPKGGGRACRFLAEIRGNRRQGAESGFIRRGPVRSIPRQRSFSTSGARPQVSLRGAVPCGPHGSDGFVRSLSRCRQIR